MPPLFRSLYLLFLNAVYLNFYFPFHVPIIIMLIVFPINDDALLLLLFLSNVIFFVQGFVTDNERALEELFGDEEDSRKGDACLNVMATRIATVFASLRVCIIYYYYYF